MTDDDSVPPGWLVDHEQQLEEAKAQVRRRTVAMEQTEPGSAARDQARERLNDAMKMLRLRTDQLGQARVAVERHRARVAQSVRWRRPSTLLTGAQVVAVVALVVAAALAGVPVWGWIVAAVGAVLCVLQFVVVRAPDLGGWPPAAAAVSCLLLVVAGLGALGVLPGWAGVLAGIVMFCVGAVLVAERFFDIDVLAGGQPS
ncbi:hypothetical protein ACFV9C_41645 [Kribbella sp. NPDC059898]|uniref:hypothetical protein n=1 Tax=Kribbella sp. NPDC059898 TaxID=3346995 RepID=UPI0036527378